MRLLEIWRYPVKSMGGEQLKAVELGLDGIPGDRRVYVQDRLGRVVTSRSKARLLLHHGTLGSDGEALVDGRPWAAPDVARDVVAAAGEGAHLVRHIELGVYDKLPLTITTDGALALLARDPRRLRPNLVIGGVDGLTERTWEGRALRIGSAVIRAVELRERCIMTTFDPDTAVQDVEVLIRIRREFGGTFALDTEVLTAGTIAVGDAVELVG